MTDLQQAEVTGSEDDDSILRKHIMQNFLLKDEVETLRTKVAELEAKSEWISCEDRLPEYGEPVLILDNGVTQNVTYFRDGADDTADWFEPFHFEHDNNMKVYCYKVKAWMPLPTPHKSK